MTTKKLTAVLLVAVAATAAFAKFLLRGEVIE